jgi:hypothetical protein
MGKLAERVGIEPTSARSRTDNGFEDRGGHQAPSTLRIVCRAGAAGKTIGGALHTPESLQYGAWLGEFTRCPLGMHQLIIRCDFKHRAGTGDQFQRRDASLQLQ